MPQRLTFHSLSAYHCGQGVGATCFISLPEYAGPAWASPRQAETIIKVKVSCFMILSLESSLFFQIGNSSSDFASKPELPRPAPALGQAETRKQRRPARRGNHLCTQTVLKHQSGYFSTDEKPRLAR